MEEEIIMRYLNGNTSTNENKDIENWLSASTENLELFKQWQKIWLYSTKTQVPTVDKHHAWAAIDERTKDVKHFDFPQSARTKWYYAAATISLVLLATFWFTYNNTSNIHWEAGKELAKRKLPDGTQVWLSSGSVLEYPQSFESNRREVILKGKAFFDVIENPNKPFLVTGLSTQIEVLGTEFMAIAQEDREEVFLNSGKVAYSKISAPSQKVILVPNELAKFDHVTDKVEKEIPTNKNLLAWKTRQLTFEDTPLPEVFSLIEEVYNVEIVNDNKFETCQLTASFNQEPIEDIWELLQTIFQLETFMFSCKIYADNSMQSQNIATKYFSLIVF